MQKKGVTTEMAEKARRFIWHPFTQMKEWEQETPTIIVEGDGVRLIDQTGREYLDGVSSLWVNLHGHRHKKIDQAIIKQLKKIAHSTLLGLTHLPAIHLAEQLLQIAPSGLTRVFYSDNGSTAVEVALKMAFGFWQHRGEKKRKMFISFANAYHGDTLGAVSVGGIGLFHGAYQPLLFKTIKVPSPTCYRCPLNLQYPSCQMACLNEVEKSMQTHRGKIAGLVIEPLLQAASGMWASPPGYLQGIRELCTRYDILMIADEVATGFGRTGKMFACEHEAVSPDLLAISKGITGGYLPLAATLTTQTIYDAFIGDYAEFKTFFHGHSYTGNPIGCAAALANLDIFKSEQVLEKLVPKIAYLKKRLRRLRQWKHVGDIRQVGMMVGIELVEDKISRRAYPIAQRIGWQVCEQAKSDGVLLRPLGNVIVLMPPLSIEIHELDQLINVVGKCIQKITARPGLK